jgi:hypothetical protein
MMAFPSMLEGAAVAAGMKVPEDPDNTKSWNPMDFPHFATFCNAQLCRPLARWGEHWENAKIIASFSEAEIKEATIEQLLARGLSFAN